MRALSKHCRYDGRDADGKHAHDADGERGVCVAHSENGMRGPSARYLIIKLVYEPALGFYDGSIRFLFQEIFNFAPSQAKSPPSCSVGEI